MRAVANLPTGKSISFFVESSVLSTKNNSQKHASDKLFAGNNTRRMSNIGTCFKTARVHFNNWNTWGSEEFLRIFYRFINFNIRCSLLETYQSISANLYRIFFALLRLATLLPFQPSSSYILCDTFSWSRAQFFMMRVIKRRASVVCFTSAWQQSDEEYDMNIIQEENTTWVFESSTCRLYVSCI